MLVIDGIELSAFDQPQQMRELERRDAIGGKQHRKPADKIPDVRSMRENVVGDNEIGMTAASDNSAGCIDTEKSDIGRNSLADSCLRDVCGGLDAEHLNGLEMLQQIAV